MDIVYVDGCVRATGLKEGRGSDNPQEFYEVMMNTVEPHYNGLSGTCADYDQCPAAPFGSMLCDSDRDGDPGTDGLNCGYGISGYGRPPGQVDDIIDCRQRTGTVGGAGVYPATN